MPPYYVKISELEKEVDICLKYFDNIRDGTYGDIKYFQLVTGNYTLIQGSRDTENRRPSPNESTS